MRTKLIHKAVLTGGLLAASTVASAGWSGNVALSTDYVWRGFSQTMEEPAVSGGFDYEHDNGLYFGVWGSNVDFGGPEHMEFDIYGGYGWSIGDLGLDVGVIRYEYFDDANTGFTELYLGGSYGPFSLTYSFDVDTDSGADLGGYLDLGAEFEVGEGFTVALHAGKYDYDTGLDPVDYSIGASKEFGGFGFDLTYHDTDSDGETLYGANGEGRLVLTVSKSL